MRYPEKIAMGIALFSALCGTAFIAVSVFGRGPHESLMTEGAVAAAMSVLSLLVSVLLVNPLSKPPGRRRELLQTRLHIDPPRVCSQHAVACTCWSLCGGPPESLPPLGEDGSGRQSSSEAGRVLSVRRRGADDCPFRFDRFRD